MSKTAKISISLPDTLLRDVERLRVGSRETRSDFFRRAAEAQLRHDREREAVERYVHGYVTQPESDDEAAWAAIGETRLGECDW